MRYHLLLPALVSAPLFGHPMGNFSVSHYAGFEITRGRTNVKYVLDLAEIPTMELLRDWKLGRTSPRADLEEKAAAQGREWAGQLQVDVNGKRVNPTFERAEFVIADGAGNLPILRITSYLHIDAAPGRLEYEDLNYAGRAGWKEIVIRGGKGAVIRSASQGSDDRSKALTEYPRDPTIAPPQDLRAAIDWRAVAPAGLAIQAAPVIQPVGQPANAPAAAAPATMTANAAPAGAVVKGDFLSRLLHQREITLGMTLIAMLVAFALGAAHALTPGHGKTIVAAYLVGSRGTLKHAAFLGAMVTFTHTISVFLLGLVTLFLFQYVMPEKITQVLGVVSGMLIVVIGGWMLYKRTRSLRRGHDHNHHGHDHGHEHHHHHDGHVHSHDHGHHHEHDHAHCHDHHQHVPDEISWGGLVALGASGGLVPCESALVLLLSAIALGRVGLGLTLLVAFSLGLAIVLMGIGVLVLYAKHLIPEGKTSSLSFLRWIPVASGALVLSIGLLMTAVSVGWLAPRWMLG